jgi:RNA polymerase sigma-70 factor (ECF subfamily)
MPHEEDFWRVIQKFVDKLPEELRIAFLLHEKENLSYQAIGEKLGYPKEKIKARVFIARRIIRQFLERKSNK